MIAPHLRLHPGQQELTPEQEAEARRFAEERIAAQLSTEPVDEPETERLLQQAYVAAQLPPPHRISWLDGPLQLVVVWAPESVKASVRASVRASAEVSGGVSIAARVWASERASVEASVGFSVRASVEARVEARVEASVKDGVGASVIDCMRDSVQDSILASASVGASVWDIVLASVQAYANADWLAFYRFFDEYLAPNALHALAHFNEQVSGYWVGQDTALLVRLPTLLARDAQGRPHSPGGKCLVYPDGWGCYAWHGVRVSEKVILRPETLTREDYLTERNMEVRRVIQERMGSRFVSELRGQVMDTGPRGTLYEVRLPEDDPERVARYVQVQDASTPRQYFLRVPPTIQTAAEAVAWSFSQTLEEYRPVQET